MAVITATFVFIFFPRQHLTSTLLHSVMFIIRFSTSQRIFGRGRYTTRALMRRRNDAQKRKSVKIAHSIMIRI